MASYSKNWRYSRGGDIKIYNSKFKTKINRFTVMSEPGSEKNDQDMKLKQDSSILIMDSKISGDIVKKGKKISIKY